MKTLLKNSKIILLLIAIIVFVGCDNSLIGIKGQGDLVKQEISIFDFEKFDLAIDADVLIVKGDDLLVEIEAQQNILENIETNVKNSEWIIKYKKNVRSHKPITITITIPEISGVYLSGSGDIYSDDEFASTNLDLKISGSGNIELIVECYKIILSISGSGSVFLEGSSNDQDISISGSGNYSAFNLESDQCDISIPGSGNCEVLVNTNLFVNISGSGSVYYKGNPTLNSDISGSGKVRRAN